MRHITTTFLRGLSVILPVVLTVWFVVWLARSTEHLMKPLFVFFLSDSYYLPGLGLVFGLVVVYTVGMLVRVFVIRRLWEAVQALFERIPLVKTIFTAISDFFDFFTSPENNASTVVGVDMGEDAQLIGFVTDDNPRSGLQVADGIERIAVYLPLSYAVGGYTLLVPRRRVTPLDMSAEEAMRLILTAGIQKRAGPD